jgi:uncharacterized membrane protein YhaH (DUF805 family)
MKKLLKHSRLNRKSYIFNLVFGYIFLLVIGSLIMWPLGALNGGFSGFLGLIGGLVLFITILLMSILFITCTNLRSRDLNINPWLSLLLLVPYIGFAFSLYLIFAPGKESEKWGETSKELRVLGFNS